MDRFRVVSVTSYVVCQIGHCARSPDWFLSQIDQITCQTRSCQIAPPARSFKSYLMPDCEVRQIARLRGSPDRRSGSRYADRGFGHRLENLSQEAWASPELLQISICNMGAPASLEFPTNLTSRRLGHRRSGSRYQCRASPE